MPAKRKQPPKKKPALRTRTTDPEQSARFLELAKNLGIETGADFERAIDAVVPRKKP